MALFTAVSGGYYLYYWMYRAWRAYRDAQGYSASSFWEAVKGRTGYRPSPFWRSLLWSYYALALFPAIERECRAHGDNMLLPPIALAFGTNFAVLASGLAGWAIVLPGLAMLPVQVAINRMNSKKAASGWGMRPMEGAITALGAIVYWGNA